MKSDNPITTVVGCDCGQVGYKLQNKVRYVDCCHSTWNQSETGSVHGINALIETTEIKPYKHVLVLIDRSTENRSAQKEAWCGKSHVAYWSHCSGFAESISLVNVGSLDQVNLMPPDIHVFNHSMQSWFELPKNNSVYKRYYNQTELGPDNSL